MSSTAWRSSIQQSLLASTMTHTSSLKGEIQQQDWSEPVDDLDFLDEFHNVVSNPEVPEADQQFTPDVFDDRYLNMELALPHGDEATPQYAKVTKRLRDANGIPIGTADDNPILDTRMCEVEFMDGTKQSLSANYITKKFVCPGRSGW